jgi:hypothetical protein
MGTAGASELELEVRLSLQEAMASALAQEHATHGALAPEELSMALITTSKGNALARLSR